MWWRTCNFLRILISLGLQYQEVISLQLAYQSSNSSGTPGNLPSKSSTDILSVLEILFWLGIVILTWRGSLLFYLKILYLFPRTYAINNWNQSLVVLVHEEFSYLTPKWEIFCFIKLLSIETIFWTVRFTYILQTHISICQIT